MTSSRHRWAGPVAAVLGPLAVGAATLPLRDRIDNTNIALLLVVTVVASAATTGRRSAAAASSLVAAATFNVLHTRPYWSFRIDGSNDVVTTALLLVVGLTVGELALRGRRARAAATSTERDLTRLQGLGDLVATGESADFVLLATASELTGLLHLVDCRFELETASADGQPMPTLARDGSINWGVVRWDAERWGFPSDGVAIPVWSRGRRRGWFVLVAPIGLPYDLALLRKAMALVDQVGAAVAA